jgi:hypothetical protein
VKQLLVSKLTDQNDYKRMTDFGHFLVVDAPVKHFLLDRVQFLAPLRENIYIFQAFRLPLVLALDAALEWRPIRNYCSGGLPLR